MKYDVFISSKSEDYSLADEVYDFLQTKGYSVFVASKELEQIGESEYSDAIDAAIDATTHMIVVASSIAHIQSKWVHYEWSTFKNDIKSGYREGNLLTILGPDVQLKDLPAGLRHQQSFSITTYKQGILGYLKLTTGAIPLSSGTLKIISDLDIQVFIDGNFKTHVKQGVVTSINLTIGVYHLKFVAEDNPSVFTEEGAFWINETGLSYSVKLHDALISFQETFNKARDLVEAADKILENENFDRDEIEKAGRLVDQAITVCPNYVPALLKKYELLNHDYTNVRQEEQNAILEHIIQIDPSNPLALLKIGINLFREKRYEEASDIFKMVAEANSKDVEYKAYAYNNMCACFMNKNNYEYALELCSQALSFCEKFEFLYNKGICLYRLNQFEKACDCFERITTISKLDKAYFHIALCCMKLNQHIQAVSNIRKFLELDVSFKYHSDNMNVYVERCMFDEVMLADVDGSVCFGYQNSEYLSDSKFGIILYACFAQALELIDKNQEALECYQRILGYDRTNGFAIEGIRNLDHSLSNRIAPMSDDMQNIYTQATAIYEEKGPREALDVLINAELRYGDNIHYELLSLMGKYYDRMGEKEKAFSYFNKTLSIYRHQPSILLIMAYYFEKEGDYINAQKIYEEIIRDNVSTDDDLLFAQNNLGILYCEMGEYEKAIHCYDKVLNIGFSGEIFFNKAYALLKSAKYSEALDFLQRATDNDPKLLTMVSLFEACCHVGLGNKNAAMKILKHSLSEKLDKSVKETVAGLNGCCYFYYGIPVSSVAKYIYKFEENLEFILNLCLCIGSTFEHLNNKEKAKETYELMLELDPNNTFAKLAIRRLGTSSWDKLLSKAK